jgi:hypothetical protein
VRFEVLTAMGTKSSRKSLGMENIENMNIIHCVVQFDYFLVLFDLRRKGETNSGERKN